MHAPRAFRRCSVLRGRRSVLSALVLALVLGLAGSAVAPAVAQQANSESPDAAPQTAPDYGADPASALANLRWREIGPANMGGRMSAVLGVPGDSRTFWVGGADGGVWKTTNGGTTFTPQWQDEEAYSVGALALAPSDHNVVWLGSGEADPRNSVSYGLGVWRSTDGGTSWTYLGLRDTERIRRIAVDPRDPDTALVCAMGHEWGPNEERGVFKTTDAGQTWRKVLYIDEGTGCSDLDLDLSNPRNVYAGMWTFQRKPWRFDDGGRETALYVSRDAGETWKKITTTPDEPMARIGLSVAQSSPNVVYLITEYPTAGTLFRSDDYGETWTMVNANRDLNFRPFYYSDVYVDPSDEDTLFTLSGGLSRSTDGGKTFQRIANTVHSDHQSFWIDPEDGDRLLSGSDGGFQVSFDGGDTFAVFFNITFSQFYQIFYDDRDPYFVCGGLQDNGNWCGPSRSKGGYIRTDDWYMVSFGDGFYAVPVPGKPNLIYSNSQGGYFYITDIHSGQVRSIEPYPRMMGSQGQGMYQAKYRFNWDAPIHISPHDPNVTYWGGNVLFKSDNEGQSWDVISPDLTTNDPDKLLDSGGEVYFDNTAAEFHCTILTVAESPTEVGVIWVGTDDGNVQVTRDDGADWTNVKDNIPGLPAETWIGKIDASSHVDGRAYIAVDNHRLNDFTPHAYRCDDYGSSCVDISGGLPQDDYVKVVREDPKNPNVLYAGMERGVYASWDGGETWHDIRLNLPRVSVRDIKIHPRDNDLIIGTHGRGAWILDDIAPIQSLAAAIEEDVYLFDGRRATRWEMWIADSFTGDLFWAGENPRDGAYINFFVASGPPAGTARPRPSAGGFSFFMPPAPPAAGLPGAPSATIRITDASGNLVRTLSPSNLTSGVNRVIWDMRWEGPRPLKSRQGGGGFFFFGGGGPPVLPGTYTATLEYEGRELSTTLEVRGDPDVDTTLAEYQEQFDALMRVRELTSKVNELIDTVFDLNGQLATLSGRLDEATIENVEQIAEQVGTAQQQLADLDNKLQRPPPRMGYRQYPRLSEELANLNGNIGATQNRPTEGQSVVLEELDQEAQERIAELNEIISTTIAELNNLLQGLPRITTEPREEGR